MNGKRDAKIKPTNEQTYRQERDRTQTDRVKLTRRRRQSRDDVARTRYVLCVRERAHDTLLVARVFTMCPPPLAIRQRAHLSTGPSPLLRESSNRLYYYTAGKQVVGKEPRLAWTFSGVKYRNEGKNTSSSARARSV